jgi:hypothetical protein
MKKKVISIILAALLILTATAPAYAKDVTAFGFDNDRKRVAEGNWYLYKTTNKADFDEMNSYFSWWEDSKGKTWLVGKSYSQPLILSPEKFAGTGLNVQRPVVIVFAANRLYAYETPVDDPKHRGYTIMTPAPLWDPIDIPGGDFSNEPAASHPTYYEDSKGNRRIYVGTSDGILVIVNLKGEIIRTCKLNTSSTNRRITSAPLVTEYMGHVVVVAGGGSDGKVHIVTNLDRKEGQSVHSWDIGGVVTSSPAPLYDNAGKIIGFVIASDGASGTVRMYEFSKILKKDANGWLVKGGTDAHTFNKGMAGIPASFAIDGKNIYFSDKRGRFIKISYQYDSQKGCITNIKREELPGDKEYYSTKTFINHSPAVDDKYVYFPIVDFKGTGKGLVVAVDKNTGKKVKATEEYGTRVVTAPVILKDAGLMFVGVESGWMAVNEIDYPENPKLMPKIGAAPIAIPEGIKDRNNNRALADGLCTEISVGNGWLVLGGTLPASMFSGERGSIIMIKLNTGAPDFIIDKIDTGTNKAEPGKTYKGIAYARRAPIAPGTDESDWVIDSVPVRISSSLNSSTKIWSDTRIALNTPDSSIQIPFEWTAPTDKNSITITAEINPLMLPPSTYRQYMERDYKNNFKTVTVPVSMPPSPQEEIIDLIAEMGEYNPALMVGETDSYSVVVRNTGSKPITTDLVWRKDGKQIRKISITIPAKGVKEDGIKFTMPNVKDGATVNVEAEVNPGRNKPANEKTFANNKVKLPVECLGPDTRGQSEGSNPYLTK